MLWNRWGTKPDLDDRGFTSGFEEEFCRARDLNAAGSMKDLAIYFKTVDVPEGLEAGPEIKKVKEFRSQCIEEKRVFFKDFLRTSEFRDLVRSKITEIGWRESNLHVSSEPGNSQAEQSPQEDAGDKAVKETKLIDQKALDFISTMSSRPLESEQTSPYEVARFRLIASSLRRSGNDELYLGNHDANLIFRYKKEISFSDQEIRALIDCGIVGFDHQNVPLWRWLAASAIKREPFHRIKVLAIVGNTEERKNAIRLLQITGEPVPELGNFLDREAVLARWFGAEADDQIFDVAAQFLSQNGTREDIQILRKISADYPADKKAKIDSIDVSIISRSSQEEALRVICANDVEKIPENFVRRIFATPSTLPTDVLINCLSAKPDGVRLRAAELLLARGELSEGSAHNLLSDSSHEIRLLAVEALHKVGKLPPPDTVQTILTIKKGNRGLGLFQPPETDATYHDRYLENRMRDLDFNALKQKVADSGVFNDKELFSLYGKFTKKMSDDLRKNLRDQFAAMFDESVKKYENIVGIDKYRSRVYQLWDFYQKQLCTRALSILCKLKNKTDIGLVRSTINAVEVDASPELLTFLAKFGDWTDIARIERLGSNLGGRRGLLEFSYPTFSNEKAASIYEIGKNRIADLLEVDLSPAIRKSLVKIFPKSVFVNLSNEALISELDRKDDEYRIMFSLRCSESLPKERLEVILDQYIERDIQRYYNSIHWLDLGACFPKKLTIAIAHREMARRWQ